MKDAPPGAARSTRETFHSIPRQTYSPAEQRSVWLVCSYAPCGKRFHPKPWTRRMAEKNQCSKACQVASRNRGLGKFGKGAG